MGNVLFNALIAGGSGGGSVQPVDYTELILDHYDAGTYFDYMTDSYDAYYEVDGEVYSLQYSPNELIQTSFTWHQYSIKHNIKIHNVTQLSIPPFGPGLYEVKRLGNTIADYSQLFTNMHGVNSNGIDFTFPASDLRGDVYMRETFYDTYIKSFPDISTLTFSYGRSYGYYATFKYAWFINGVDISTLVPTFYNENDPIDVSYMYNIESTASSVSGTIPADKTWNNVQTLWINYTGCFHGLEYCDNYQDAVTAGWA